MRWWWWRRRRRRVGGEEEKLKEVEERWLMDILSVALQNNLPRKQTIDAPFPNELRTIAGGRARSGLRLSAEASSSGLGMRTHSCLNPSRNQSGRD